MRFPALDVVLRLTAGAVDVLVDGAAGQATKAGDREPRIGALRSGLDERDDTLHPVPACGRVAEVFEPAQLGAIGHRGGAGGRALLKAEDVFAQRRRGGDAERVVQPTGAAEPQYLRRAEMAVGTQHDLDSRPVAADGGNQTVQPS